MITNFSSFFANSAPSYLLIGEFITLLTSGAAILSVMLCYYQNRLGEYRFSGDSLFWRQIVSDVIVSSNIIISKLLLAVIKFLRSSK